VPTGRGIFDVMKQFNRLHPKALGRLRVDIIELDNVAFDNQAADLIRLVGLQERN
jgi:hypothetical protein